MMPSTGYFKLEGAAELKARMDQLSRVQIRKIALRAVRAAADPILDRMRRNVHISKTAGLKRSLAIKSKLYGKGTTAVTIVGPDTAYNVPSPYSKRYVHRPSKIAHLIAGGHRIVLKGGKDTGKRTRAFPFVNEAAEQGHAASMRIMDRELAAGIQEAWAGEFGHD